MQALYAYYNNAGTASINDMEKQLFFSVNKSYDLYHYLLVLLIDIANLSEKRLDQAQNKKLPSQEDLNPNRKFIDNRLINGLRINNDLLLYLEKQKLSWTNQPNLIKGLLEEILKSDVYIKYMNSTVNSYTEDKNFVIAIYTSVIAAYEPLYTVLEEQSIFWNDEVEFIIGAIIKLLKNFKENQYENAKLQPLFKSPEDKEFTKKLFRKVILNKENYQELIQQFSKNWELERIAFMDILLIEMAIAEVTDFESIPVKVTFNEYIELSKYYSTNRSHVFINGVLDKIIQHLKDLNKINKSGRGLIGGA